jgi:hypothetical protein
MKTEQKKRFKFLNYRSALKIRTATEPKNFKLMHAAKLKCLSFNVPHVIAASELKLWQLMPHKKLEEF